MQVQVPVVGVGGVLDMRERGLVPTSVFTPDSSAQVERRAKTPARGTGAAPWPVRLQARN